MSGESSENIKEKHFGKKKLYMGVYMDEKDDEEGGEEEDEDLNDNDTEDMEGEMNNSGSGKLKRVENKEKRLQGKK